MSSTLNDTMETAKDAMKSAKDGTEHAVSSVRSTFLDAAKTVIGVVTMLRSLDVDDGLGWFGLARRRSAFGSVALFGAGFVAGAGVSLLFAPMSGADARRAILERFNGLKREANDTIDHVESEAKEVEHKAEQLAGKAKDALKKAEHKVEDKVTEGAEAVKDAVKSKADAVASAAKGTAEEARLLICPTDAPAKSPTSAEVPRPGRPQHGQTGGERFS